MQISSQHRPSSQGFNAGLPQICGSQTRVCAGSSPELEKRCAQRASLANTISTEHWFAWNGRKYRDCESVGWRRVMSPATRPAWFWRSAQVHAAEAGGLMLMICEVLHASCIRARWRLQQRGSPERHADWMDGCGLRISRQSVAG